MQGRRLAGGSVQEWFDKAMRGLEGCTLHEQCSPTA